MFLNEESIKVALETVSRNLAEGDPDAALDTLEMLDFERLLHPIFGRDKGTQHEFIDPAVGFGPKRVHETGDHLRACIAALKRSDQLAALKAAQQALERWQRRV